MQHGYIVGSLTVWSCVLSYDVESADGKDKFEGITKLVEHPIQMKPPGKFVPFCFAIYYTAKNV